MTGQTDTHPLDLRVDKLCYSAMIQGSSNRPAILRQRQIDTLLIGGTVTNVCCESTARDAMMQNFRSIMADDALCALSVDEHVQSLQGWMLYFGDVLSSEEIIARLKCEQPPFLHCRGSLPATAPLALQNSLKS